MLSAVCQAFKVAHYIYCTYWNYLSLLTMTTTTTIATITTIRVVVDQAEFSMKWKRWRRKKTESNATTIYKRFYMLLLFFVHYFRSDRPRLFHISSEHKYIFHLIFLLQSLAMRRKQSASDAFNRKRSVWERETQIKSWQ